MLSRLFCFILISAAISSHADDCSKIEDLSKDLGPVHSQANTSWCYAFTAADLISQKMQKMGALKPGEVIHPLQVAGDYHDSPAFSTWVEGTSGQAFNRLNDLKKINAKLCTNADLGADTSKDHFLFKNSADKAMPFFIAKLRSKSTMDCNMKDKNVRAMERLDSEIKALSAASWKNDLGKLCSKEIPQLNWNYTTIGDRCKAIKENRDEENMAENGKKVQATLDYALEHGSMAAISYSTRAIEKTTSNGLHFSSVVARERSPEGECYYKIRNSWGPGCGGYKDVKNCSKGYLWVKRSTLITETCSIEYLK